LELGAVVSKVKKLTGPLFNVAPTEMVPIRFPKCQAVGLASAPLLVLAELVVVDDLRNGGYIHSDGYKNDVVADLVFGYSAVYHKMM